ncbi:hypothetical protein GCM10011611_16400 [Aliidongia dinghuensis]|uniref:Uncharacterized protein n=1 Tax=Aliidongia dinghuensis TaxID=1867774 RepID=A0A8J2YRY4_9PROT|nr:hypothetical protein [Aliidongia dinghuensis]GGF11455.1 hypothetical protein GCM10011611_16400 [Aliidongia dinghuensis]
MASVKTKAAAAIAPPVAAAPAAPTANGMVDRIPGLTDEALATLRQNALRLEANGTAQQRAAAASMLPAINAEFDARTAAKLDERRTAAAASRKQIRAKTAVPA